MRVKTITAVAALVTVLFAPDGFAQQGELGQTAPTEISSLPIDQLPPGARALGLGGAFTAVADDATAALANPAGLTNLSAPEVSVFIRNTDADVNFLDADAFTSGYNALTGQTDKTFSDSSTNVSFASFVVPMEGFVISGFYSNQLDFSSPQTADDIYYDDIDRGGFAFLDQYTNFNSISGELENFGVSMAFRFTDRFSGGITVRNSRLDLASNDSWSLDWWNDVEWDLADLVYGLPEGRFATTEEAILAQAAINDRYTYSTAIDGSESDLALDAGLYYRGDQWSFGFAYHSGSEFKFETLGSIQWDLNCNSAAEQILVDTCIAGLGDGFSTSSSSVETQRVRLPSVMSFGAAWRPADTWLISFDANLNEYSVLTPPRSVTLGFGLDINDAADRATYFDPAVRALSGPVTEPISDEMTYHLGLEKSFVFDAGFLRTLALRTGAFTVADHDGVVAYDSDETVWTVGLGSTWGKNELGAHVFQVDLGAGFADDVTNIVLSGIYRF